MTQQFKFGDMVKSRMRPNKTLGLVVDTGSNQYSYIIRWNDEKGVSQEHTESLELIPHPDTVRLNWLVKNDCGLTDMLHDKDEDLSDTPFAVFQIQENHFEVLAAANNIRDAIDIAMKMDAKEQQK